MIASIKTLKYLTSAQFLFYFIRFRLQVYFGFHTTAFPTDISWRWRHWEQIQRNRGSHYRKKVNN